MTLITRTLRHGPKDGMPAHLPPGVNLACYPALAQYDEPMRHVYQSLSGGPELEYVGLRPAHLFEGV